VPLHDVSRHQRDVARLEAGRNAQGAPQRRQILDVLGRDRISMPAQVPDPRAATPSGGRSVHRDGRLGAGGGSRTSRPCEARRQRAPQHHSSRNPHGFAPRRRMSVGRRANGLSSKVGPPATTVDGHVVAPTTRRPRQIAGGAGCRDITRLGARDRRTASRYPTG
jgi:hypothetical protein